uniref:CSON011247 protein n=1 Tax=Culicoides sonorensis TaxID=179676 RepID=A0A336M747_CULSO
MFCFFFNCKKLIANKHNLNRAITVDQYVPMNLSADSTALSTPSSSAAAKLVNYENVMVRVPNPKRKLKRQKDNSDSKSFEAFFAPKSETSNSITATTPSSPTNYQQPPTPDHPPPSAQTAERMILDRIRPLSQVRSVSDCDINSNVNKKRELPKIIVTHSTIHVNHYGRNVFETDV